MTKEHFKKLSIHDKGIIVFTEGNCISTRMSGYNKISLYSLYDFYVEVYSSEIQNKILTIQILSLESKNKFYEDIIGNYNKRTF